jgi:cell fate regulator YaaT (PSP1 superfamily)
MIMDELTDFIIGIRFTRLGKIYHFKANNDQDTIIGDVVLVETSRGYQLGEVVQIVTDLSQLTYPNVKSIIRKANEEDIRAQQYWMEEEQIALRKARKILAEKNQRGIKVVHTEYGYMGESLSVLVTSVNDQKVNLTPIISMLQQTFPNTQINVRQVGPRDVAKLYGGIGACGLTERCCSQFINSFNSISIRMAKEQEISLTPEEITGMCGRLRCCLEYEYEQYREGRRGLPKKNKWVETPDGIGRVNVVLPLRSSVLVYIPDSGMKEYEGDQVSPAQRPQRSESTPTYQRSPRQSSQPSSERSQPVEEISQDELESLDAENINIDAQTPKPKPNKGNRNFNKKSRPPKNQRKNNRGGTNDQ